jgi:hypothetical protein
MYFRRRLWTVGLAVLTAAVLASSARADDKDAKKDVEKKAGPTALDKFLPADTEVYFSLNFKEIFNSGLAKKLNLDKARDALKDVEEVQSVLKDLGFDPFTDLETITAAGPGGDAQDKGLFIFHGVFDLDKFKAKGEEAAKSNPDILKISKSGDHTLYEVIPPGGDISLWVVLPDKGTILASPGKDYILDALKKADGKEKPGLKSKEFAALLEKMSPKQSLSIAALGSALLKGQLGDTPAKEVLEKLDAVGGGVTLSDDLKLEIVFTTKSGDDAKDVEKQLNDGVNSALTIVGLLAGGQKEFGVVLDLLKSIKVKADGKTVTVKGLLDADAIDKILKKDL